MIQSPYPGIMTSRTGGSAMPNSPLQAGSEHAEETIRWIVEVASQATGQGFFESLVRHLCQSCQCKYAFVARIDAVDLSVAHSVAVACEGRSVENFSYSLRGTPCEAVVRGTLCHYPTDVSREFPEDRLLVEMGVDSYMGVSLRSSAGQVLGLAVLLHIAPLPDPAQAGAILQVVAARAGAELERRNDEQALRQSEHYLRTVIDTQPECLKLVSPEGTLLQMNPAGLAMVEANAEAAAIGRCVFDLVAPEHRERFMTMHQRVCAGAAETLEFEIIGLKGTRRWMETHAVPFRRTDDAPAMQLAITRDITARRQAEEAMQMMRFSVDHAGDSVFWVSRDGRILYANDAACANRGYTREELLGRTVFDLDPDFQPDVWEPHFEELKCRGTLTFETRHRTKGGRIFPIEVNANYVRIGDREFNFAFVRDITDRRRAEEERRRLDAQMVHTQKMESLGLMAGGVAHDFNNLLASVLGNASLAVLRLPADSPARPLLREIENAAQRASELTQQLLAYSGKGKFHIQPLSLDAMVREMTSLLHTVVSKKATFQLDLQPAAIEGDPTQIRQIVMNLITNASDALEGRSGIIAISTRSRQMERDELHSTFVQHELPAGPYACLTVADTGCGMTPETMSRMFEPFFTTKFTGRGLGLAAVVGIVRGHRGALHVDSAPGRGTTMQLYFPLAAATPAAAPKHVHAADQSADDGMILLIEDEPLVRTMIQRTLESTGLRVFAAADGVEGVEMFQRHREEIRAVLLDLTMPRLDGWEVAARIAADRPDLPIYLMSGYSEPQPPAGLTANVVGFLNKPFKAAEILEAARKAMGAGSTSVSGK